MPAMKHLLFILLGALILAGCDNPAPKDKFDEAAKTLAAGKAAAIRREAADLNGHAWAGDYYEGDGLGVNRCLTLAPKGGFVFEWHGCMGCYDRNYGPVSESNGHLRLHFTFPNSRGGFQGLPDSFTPVVWGERHYLVADDGFVDFCNAFNSDPAGFRPHTALLRKGDEAKPLRGKPPVPPEYARYLLDRPVTASVIAVDKPTPRTSRFGTKHLDFTLTLDAGTTSGLLEGMELRVIEPASVWQSGKVIRVEENRCEVRIIQDAPEAIKKTDTRPPTAAEPEWQPPAPSTRWRFSTRASYGRDLPE